MRLLCPLSLLFAAGCVSNAAFKAPPNDAFYFPTGIVYDRGQNSTLGFLYVASSNFDRRYDTGSVLAVNLDQVRDAEDDPLPAVGAIQGRPDAGSRPQAFERLGNPGRVLIQTFAGEMVAYRPDGGSAELFVPSRGERNPLQIIRVGGRGTDLSCLEGGIDCGQTAISLTEFEHTPTGKPRAPDPVGVGIFGGDRAGAFVTHLRAADSPAGSGNQFESYVVYLNPDSPQIKPENFISLGLQTTSSVAVGGRFAYVTSRYQGPTGAMLVLVDRQQTALLNPPVYLEARFSTLEARGIAFNRDESRLYVATRNPDDLVVVSVANPLSSSPALRVVRYVPLPPGPNQVMVIPRDAIANLAPLVVVTCSTAGAVSIYDDGTGQVVAQLYGVGVQPYGIAASVQGNGARIFISNFGDGRIALVDVSDLRRPQEARTVAFLGRAQVCPSTDQDIPCVGNPP